MIGAGQMATALAEGFVRSGLVATENITAADPDSKAGERFAKATGGRTFEENSKVVADSDVVFLAVKPQQMAAVTAELAGKIAADKLLVSIAAGVRLAAISEVLGPDVKLVRVMPNTPCLVGHGACGFCLGQNATEEDGKVVEELLGAVGVAYRVDEKLLDAVTGLSGSGPAFVYMVIEALSDGGVRMGLPRNVATALATQTVRGAAEMVAVTGEHTGVLRDRVTSPGGTTIAGIEALESAGVRAALMSAVEAATRRSVELGAVS